METRKTWGGDGSFSVSDELASSCVFVSGLDQEADERAIDWFAFAGGFDVPVDNVALARFLSAAPAVVSLSWPTPNLLDEDKQRIAEMEVCLAAAFFESLFPESVGKPN
ncbi:MAG: hypothetical protein HY238_05610 [Acidobacteria bacterium]|nr:hypothetical protein [Acidobacteriota bacterium]